MLELYYIPQNRHILHWYQNENHGWNKIFLAVSPLYQYMQGTADSGAITEAVSAMKDYVQTSTKNFRTFVFIHVQHHHKWYSSTVLLLINPSYCSHHLV
jgi:hypothetical protein